MAFKDKVQQHLAVPIIVFFLSSMVVTSCDTFTSPNTTPVPCSTCGQTPTPTVTRIPVPISNTATPTHKPKPSFTPTHVPPVPTAIATLPPPIPTAVPTK